MIETIKVKPWGKDQGDHVVINAEDFDPKVHELAKGEVSPAQAASPLDHDGDGASGGSVKGFHATAAKGARKRKAKRSAK